MAIHTFKKYKISLHHDSKKTQGLRTGDIVRRQYFDGTNLIYSLMCVLSYGKEKVTDKATQKIVERNYFIGALLEGDTPHPNEILDFARVTSLFDTSRLGAMYLTGSDDQAPFMDVIDGIGRNASLSWPEGIASKDYADAESQYVVKGDLIAEYIPFQDGNNRVLKLQKKQATTEGTIGIQQDFYKYVQNPNRVLVSYKIKGSRGLSCTMSLSYQDGTRVDGEETYNISTEWEYKLHAVTVDYSGRHLRSVKLDLTDMKENDEVLISDFNIILLSSVANFEDASKMRIGKLTGVSDPVFGQLSGYGGYMQKLFASQSAHISGTLTAGDENGFASTFYAGKIHRNVFINSLDVDFATSVVIDGALENPTGMGYVYKLKNNDVMNAQTNKWALQHIGKRYTLSFWLYTDSGGQISLLQNGNIIDTIHIPESTALEWVRYKTTFDIQVPNETEQLNFSFAINLNATQSQVYFTSPQLESGEIATQYQPTDQILNPTEDYGAWFARGGIGGTIQNPLLKLNSDGSIASKNSSFIINNDGTGQFADGRFKWTKDEILLQGVTIKWDELDPSTQEQMKPKSIRIIGEGVFNIVDDTYVPESITLEIVETNFVSSSSGRKWYYLNTSGEYVLLEGENGRTLTISPVGEYWKNKSSLTIKCVASINKIDCVDTITIQKRRDGHDAYSVNILTSNGNTFKNGVGSTTLTAHVYRGGVEITDTLFPKDFDWIKNSENPESDAVFNASHIGFGNKLTITSDDIWNIAQLSCKVTIN